MRCEHINQQNDWAIGPPTINRNTRGSAMAPPSCGVMQWHDVLEYAPMGPPHFDVNGDNVSDVALGRRRNIKRW